MDVRLIFKPDVKPLPSHLPGIDMRNPLKPTERLIPELEIEESDEGEILYFVTVPVQAARQILASDGHVWKLWEPFELQVPSFDGHGGMGIMTVTSIDPKAGRLARTPSEQDASGKAGKKAAAPVGKAGKKAEKPVAPRIDAAEVGSELDNILAQEG